jgi:hypothetical protein
MRRHYTCLWAAFAVLLAVAGPLFAAEEPAVSQRKPLLSRPESVAALNKAIADFQRMEQTGQKIEEGAPAPRAPNIYVTAIADYGGGQWTVWANGYRINPNRQPPDFTVLAVNTDRAEIEVKGEQPIRVTLRSAQTWRSRSQDVVEGIFP